ncbi:hypothetical protein BX600DRAFT_495739 [Xylariales sp. PMI_506]|nr:hypothetical protein BX600DRAFT_495739 [Xylariales sp. PMI_506]
MDAMQLIPWPSITLRGLTLLYYAKFGSIGDGILLGACVLWQQSSVLSDLLDGHTWDALLLLCAVASGIVLSRSLLVLRNRSADGSKWAGPMKPLLFPCKTTHTRLFPQKHSFEYSYLMVGAPVDWTGNAGGMISVGESSGARRGWYQIKAGDYLERGSEHLGLRDKLNSYLQSQGADPASYPYAYLVTAAKFMGYHFNPVSFWYLYSAQRDLAAMILEVNNTFDERRMYFLTSEDLKSVEDHPCETETGLSKDKKGPVSSTLRRAWPKDFHVSPFNSRKGSYSLVAHDPWAPVLEGSGSINNTITLVSSKNHPKLIARIFSIGNAIDPTTMNTWRQIQFLLTWWWVGFVTFPRIVKEAGLLFFRRKLHVWFRPEPLKNSMGRRADDNESQLELVFRRYLRYLVSQCSTSLAIRYIPSGIANAQAEIIKSPLAEKENTTEEVPEMELKVLTPVFYSRFVYYAHDFEAMFSELQDNCTICVSRPDLLPKLVLKKPAPALHTSSYLEFSKFKLIQKLRKRPQRIERPLTSSQSPTGPPGTYTKTDIRDFRLSSMDGYVLAEEDAETKTSYSSTVLKLFLADKLALGSVEVLWLEHFILRAILAWATIAVKV